MIQGILAAAFAVAAAANASASAETAADHYYWRPAATDGAPRPYVVLLPGSSGLKIFDDDRHYFRAAAWLNALGLDALVVDYQKAVKFVPAAKKGRAGARMRIIVEDALAAMRAGGRADPACPAAVMAWSLGAEGAWEAAAGAPLAQAVVLFYPTTRAPLPYRNRAPALALQGEADDVTPMADLETFVAARAPDAAPIVVKTYAGARHGFDIESLAAPRSMKFPPLVGRTATFGYDAAAATAAHAEAEAFLRTQGVVGGRCL